MPDRLTCLVAAVLAALALPAAAQTGAPVDQGPRNVPEFSPAFPNQTRAPAMESGMRFAVETLADGLVHPWGIAVLPGGGYLVTERAGRLRHLAADGTLGPAIAGVPEVLAQRQGGLLDVALAPDFAESRVIFLSYAKPMGRGRSATAVARAELGADLRRLEAVRDIFVQTPPSPTPAHYGSRVVASGDHVFITTGEHFTARERQFAQHPDKSYGKVMRLTADGDVPADNPFAGDADALGGVWSLGHRNPQGAAIRPSTGALWTLEHGPAGGDELNRIAPGANYGWPVVSYGENYSGRPVGSGAQRRAGFVEPRYYWDPVIAPGGFVFYRGDMFADWEGDILAASLNPGGLVRLRLEGDRVAGEERFFTGEARMRDVAIDRDGALLVLTDARNGAVLRLTPGGG
ncbi:PQQ-dependent sugar dehydrogenase [Rhodovulum sp. YNF3179]|uniref:PQQ-dependent sugar dehydrogenase n=1 Tax=Rhodovulum sp. YNF3179 TaxID=3425127 RepID=UPI003D343419